MVDALHQKKWKRVLVQISCALNVGYMSTPNAVSVTNHTVSNTLIGGALLQTLHLFVEFVKKIPMDIRTWMLYDEVYIVVSLNYLASHC